ncbi:hypothetical protein ADEAN_000222200 [Angomonas deanei]|uniref:Uncharacterized protein n=1 Tax=Angomonas deanei TaxID=59799 RepID=A0A7G2C6U3_9TRYP|nr:hypothetical protein ADEAN_000222200 [Angomonas deanei]
MNVVRRRAPYHNKRAVALAVLYFVLLSTVHCIKLFNVDRRIPVTSTTTTTTAAPTRESVTAPPSRAPDPTRAQDVRAVPEFEAAVSAYYENLRSHNISGNPQQPSKDFTEIDENQNGATPVAFDSLYEAPPEQYHACDNRNATFSSDRDRACQAYLSNLHNIRYIKALPVKLLHGRTIKAKVLYAHHNISAIVKISQRKFVYEAASEYAAYAFDRALEFNRVPTTVYIPFPVDFLRAATSYDPFYSHWFENFVVLYNYTNSRFVTCDTDAFKECIMVSIQLWMQDVHPALDTFLALPYHYTDPGFIAKHYQPGDPAFSSLKNNRLRAAGDVLDRFIFDFLIGNSDRGLDYKNNYVYGGCSKSENTCELPPPAARLKGLATYAFLDHGSSLYAHKETDDNLFSGAVEDIKVCRFRRSTYAHLLAFQSSDKEEYPLWNVVRRQLPPSIYNVSYISVLKKVQVRLDKVLRVVELCLNKYPDSEVFSMPEYDQVRIFEEDAILLEES